MHRVPLVALASVVVLASACGEPLENLPGDVVANGFFFPYEQAPGVFVTDANFFLQTSSCVQLADGTQFLFEGVAAFDPILGGRTNNPLAAYVAVACEQPSAWWGGLPGDLEAPYTFELVSGDVSAIMEIDEDGEVTQCDFPSCFYQAPADEPAPRPVE